VLPAVQAVEVGDALDAEQHRFTFDHKGALAVSERGLDDERKRWLQSYPLRVNSRTRLPSR
jgi:hypothetical protein